MIEWFAETYTWDPDYWIHAECACGWKTKSICYSVPEGCLWKPPQDDFIPPKKLESEVEAHKKWHKIFPWAEEIAS